MVSGVIYVLAIMHKPESAQEKYLGQVCGVR